VPLLCHLIFTDKTRERHPHERHCGRRLPRLIEWYAPFESIKTAQHPRLRAAAAKVILTACKPRWGDELESGETERMRFGCNPRLLLKLSFSVGQRPTGRGGQRLCVCGWAVSGFPTGRNSRLVLKSRVESALRNRLDIFGEFAKSLDVANGDALASRGQQAARPPLGEPAAHGKQSRAGQLR
jgi:hypothetical protein